MKILSKKNILIFIFLFVVLFSFELQADKLKLMKNKKDFNQDKLSFILKIDDGLTLDKKEVSDLIRKDWDEIGERLGSQLKAEGLEIRLTSDTVSMHEAVEHFSTLPEYASGVTFLEKGLILVSLQNPKSGIPSNYQSVLKHELVHFYLFRLSEKSTKMPNWFTEGMAVALSNEQNWERIKMVGVHQVFGNMPSFLDLEKTFQTKGKSGQIDLAYAQAADVALFLLRQPDSRWKIRRYIRHLAEGDSSTKSFLASFSWTEKELEEKWKSDLEKRSSFFPLFVGGGFFWGMIIVLVFFVWRRKRKMNQKIELKWKEEEGVLLWDKFQQDNYLADDVILVSEPLVSENGIPFIVVNGKNYPLH